MRIDDRVYGRMEIKQPVIIELINSKPFQRIFKVNQAGASQYVMDKPVSRGEHCIGTAILLKKLGASLEEQIAGLLHDLPHTAFSHVIDYVFRNKNHDYHEKFHDKIVLNSEIPRILEKYGFSVERLLDEKNFPLLEMNIPDLCADRIDYTLRDIAAHNGSSEKVTDYIPCFVVHNNEIIMNNKEQAKKFTEDYLRMDENSWSNPREIAIFEVMASAIRKGLENEIILEQDLFQYDDYVYQKLKNSGNIEILAELKKLNPNFRVIENKEDYDYFSKNKLRYINPKFVNRKGEIQRLTDAYPEFAERLEEHNNRVKEGHYIKVVGW